MNIQDMSPDFIESLTPEQMATLLKDMASKAQEAPQAPVLVEATEAANGYDGEFAMPRSKAKQTNQPVKWEENKFQDDGAECKGEENETPVVKRSERTRKPPQFRMIRCSKCGRDFEKRSDHIFGTYHVCHRCGGNR